MTSNTEKLKNLKNQGHGILRGIYKSLKTSIDEAPPELKRPAKKMLIVAAVLFVTITAYKIGKEKYEEHVRARELAAGPIVRAALITRSLGEHTSRLIGETRPYQSVTLYAKVSGYLKAVKVDKGDVVKQGQVLAVIESPETDQEFEAALANSKNKKDIAARTMTLRKKGLVSEQEAEQAQSDADVAAARLHSQETLKGYEIVRAPFPGTVTARFADPGALVQNATSSQASALPVVTVSQIRQLRVDAFLDQREAPFVATDAPVEITVAERPGLKIEGRINRVADQLDPHTKMMLAEIDIPNEDRTLVAGSFVQVAIKVQSPPYFEAPVESLVLKDNKSYITAITADSRLTYKPVDIASNDGKFLHIVSGVQVGDQVAIGVGDTIPEGGKIRILADSNPIAKIVPKPSEAAK
jgi:membrane fusion protein (multidrug efflux system)